MFCPLGRITLALVSGLFAVAPVSAATSSARASATVVAPARVAANASTQLLLSSTVGVLMLYIPGRGGSAGSAPFKIALTAKGDLALGSPIVFSPSNSAGLASLIARLANSGGTLTTSGTLSGTGVQIVVLQAAQRRDGSTVTAIVTYN